MDSDQPNNRPHNVATCILDLGMKIIFENELNFWDVINLSISF